MQGKPDVSRRSVLKSSAAATTAAAMLAALGTNFAHAQGSDKLRVGIVGAGGRGSGAVGDITNASRQTSIPIEMMAVGDAFEDVAKAKSKQWKVKDDNTFWGLDAYKKVLATDIDLVILATPPGFRPYHFQAAVEAGKNIFFEKPVAVDPTGVRIVIEASEKAEKKGLAAVTGTQRRHQDAYRETIKRIHDGAIGDIQHMSVYWNQGGLWNKGRKPEWSDLEWQMRNWLYFTWLSGDHICEQHIHNLDVSNWVFNAHPTKAYGMGGRQVRTDPAYGHIYDHFAIEYEYPNGGRTLSFCRQQDGTKSNVSEFAIGTKGRSNPGGWIQSDQRWSHKQAEGGDPNPYVVEHMDLLRSIKAGKPLNEGKRIAESTLTAIMGRMSAYTGQEVTWDQAINSKLNLMPEKLEFGPMPVPPVAMPGKDKLI